MKRVRVKIRKADGTEIDAKLVEGIVENARGKVLVTCAGCETGPNGEQTCFFVDVLVATSPRGPHLCEACEKALLEYAAPFSPPRPGLA